MTQVTKQVRPSRAPGKKRTPASPRQAARRRSALDKQLDTELFKALADPTRAKLLSCLIKCGRECSVTEVAECCSVDFSVVARHLSRLAGTGILESHKAGRTMWYAANGPLIADRLRALADAIDEWPTRACCGTDACSPCSTPTHQTKD